MRPWLARFSFSFFIIAFVLIWTVYTRRPLAEWRILLYLFSAMLCIVMGVLGIRERHR